MVAWVPSWAFLFFDLALEAADGAGVATGAATGEAAGDTDILCRTSLVMQISRSVVGPLLRNFKFQNPVVSGL